MKRKNIILRRLRLAGDIADEFNLDYDSDMIWLALSWLFPSDVFLRLKTIVIFICARLNLASALTFTRNIFSGEWATGATLLLSLRHLVIESGRRERV